MKLKDTNLEECRYGDLALRLWGEGECIYFDCYADYQGNATIFIELPKNVFLYYYYSYGSCSGCDEWEASGLTDEEIMQEMRNGALVLEGENELSRYMRMLDTTKKDKEIVEAIRQRLGIYRIVRF